MDDTQNRLMLSNKLEQYFTSFSPCNTSLLKSKGLVVIRCQDCGDSKKHKNKGHLYVQVRFKENEKPWYKCHKCGMFGYIDEYFLSKYGIFDDDLNTMNKRHNYVAGKNFGSTGLKNNNIKPLKLCYPLNTSESIAKIKYVENRLNIKITKADIIKYKMIINFKHFLKCNDITSFTRKDIDFIDKYYIGFLTSYNEFINFRIIDDNLIDQYHPKSINYNIFDLSDNTKKFITLKRNKKIDMMDDVELVTAEGMFDLLGIYNHVYKRNEGNRIFVANNGMSQYNTVRHYNKLGFLFSDLKIFADKGVTMDYYRDMIKKLDYHFHGNTTVIYNRFQGEKDFGVPLEKMQPKAFYIDKDKL